MSDTVSIHGAGTEVAWERSTPDEHPDPLVTRTPYAELKLEHSGLEPTGFGESFFPDAVPYSVDGVHRVFYWRHALRGPSVDLSTWTGVCATTNALSIISAAGAADLALVTPAEDGTDIVIDGTVAGDSTTARVRGYETPDVVVRQISDSRLDLVVDGVSHVLRSDTRRRISVPEQTVDPVGDGDHLTTIGPELVVRLPGERTVHHPAPNGAYRLFPSFGLDLEEIPNPLKVPTTNGELDDDTLARSLGVDLAVRPYPERVLWQAFAYTAFDPHAEAAHRLLQFASGHLAVPTGAGDGQ